MVLEPSLVRIQQSEELRVMKDNAEKITKELNTFKAELNTEKLQSKVLKEELCQRSEVITHMVSKEMKLNQIVDELQKKMEGLTKKNEELLQKGSYFVSYVLSNLIFNNDCVYVFTI